MNNNNSSNNNNSNNRNSNSSGRDGVRSAPTPLRPVAIHLPLGSDSPSTRPSSCPPHKDCNKRKGDEDVEDVNKSSGPEIKKEPVKIKLPCENPKTLFMLDGEHAQLMFLLRRNYKIDAFDISILKLAAACSATQQPCDIMRSFHILHQFFTNNTYSRTDFSKVSRPSYMADVMALLANIPSSSRKVFEEFFAVAESAISKAYTSSCVAKGFSLMGISGPTKNRSELYDIRQTMSQWLHWNTLTANKQDELLARCYTFADRLIDARSKSSSVDGGDIDGFKGTALDKEMEAAFGDIVGTLKYDCQEKDLALNRWRAVLINDPSVYEVYMQKVLLKQQKIIQKKRSKKEDTAATDGMDLDHSNSGTATVTADANQTKVSCMLCKQSFMRPRGSRYLVGLPALWRGCDNCKKAMCCGAQDCVKHLATHTQYCALSCTLGIRINN
jgi:hypothetical protein